MFGTDLTRDYEMATRLGCTPDRAFLSGVQGALCDTDTRSRLQSMYDSTTWS